MTQLLMRVLVNTQWHDPVGESPSEYTWHDPVVDERAIRMQLRCVVQSSGLTLFLNLSAKLYLVGRGGMLIIYCIFRV